MSREKPSLYVVVAENDTHLIGSFLEGLGLMGVRFPKESTRELTDEEKEFFRGKVIGIGDSPIGSTIRC